MGRIFACWTVPFDLLKQRKILGYFFHKTYYTYVKFDKKTGWTM
jgi:hypothetical protein